MLNNLKLVLSQTLFQVFNQKNPFKQTTDFNTREVEVQKC